MKTAAELYTECDKEPFYGPCDYNRMLDEFGEILIQVDDQDYQGDSRLLYKRETENGEEYGYLHFGWGSCSGCDALQACENMNQVQELMNGLYKDIQWDSKEGMLSYFLHKDWSTHYSYGKEQEKFIREVITLLQD